MESNERLSDGQENLQETVIYRGSENNAGPLWSQICQRSLHALNCGALESIPTYYEFVEQAGVRFLVRILANLNRKEQAKKQQQALKDQGQDFNPFLPYEPDLFVTNVSPTHLCLLNKFNVVDHHILIVTREFESQDTWLNHNDFAALWMGLQQIDGLVFYNGGKDAGASQPHKHLQLVPLTIVPDRPGIPIETLLPLSAENMTKNDVGLPFHHGFITFDLPTHTAPNSAAATLLGFYWQLLNKVGIAPVAASDRHTHPYNLLITRRWMLLVPRRQEKAETISINSLGFAGSLFVKNTTQLERLKACGPMTLLQNVTYPLRTPLPLNKGVE